MPREARSPAWYLPPRGGRPDQPLHAVDQLRHIKVDEQSSGAPREAHVRQHPGLMHWQQPVHRFQFDHHEIFDKQIDRAPPLLRSSV